MSANEPDSSLMAAPRMARVRQNFPRSAPLDPRAVLKAE